jgi:hypothetical protein
MRRWLILGVVLVLAMLVLAPGALGAGHTDLSKKEAAGWVCGAAAELPPGHCISPGTAKNLEKTAANGRTFQILVFDPEGNFLAAESASFHPGADARPCPHDPEADPDGTWWNPGVPGLFVCHHQPPL